MILRIKNRIEQELNGYIRNVDKLYHLSKISPLLYGSIKNFIRRKGKRIRPVLFVVGYLGFSREAAAGLYRSAVSLELLHDFMLVHDDIIDKSLTRRGEPSMHEMLNFHLLKHKNLKFSGQDLSIVVGDVMYAMALDAFLSVKEELERKELALRKLITAALYTGSGEFIELLYGIKDIDKITREGIYKIYDFKTAHYTFATPLCMGAILAGAKRDQADRLFKSGIYLGRAFQVKDDIIGIFNKEARIGKSNLTDIQEAKRTILLWHAYVNASKKNKSVIKRILSKTKVDKSDLFRIRKIILASGTLDYAKREINTLIKKAQGLIKSSGMQSKYKESLLTYSRGLLNL